MITAVAENRETTAICATCGKERRSKPSKSGEPKAPLGWKRRDGQLFCGDCWRKSYVLRAVTIPVAKPLSGSWKELEASLKVMWAQTTAASNWMMTQCYVRDVRRNGEDKMPGMPGLYLYPEARELFPNLPPQTIVSLEQAVQRKYRAKRYDIVWTAAATLPSMRYPQPFPVHNQSWSVEINEQGQAVVSARIGDSRWDLQLKAGARFWRQIAGIRSMAERGELAIYKMHDGTIMCKLVGWLERAPSKTGTGSLMVRTCNDKLLVAVDAKENTIWSENCDYLPRLIAQHRRQLQRLAEDQKAEQRPVASFTHRREELTRQHSARMKSALQETASHLSNFAVRRRFASVVYSDSERWLDQFPYFALEERIKTNLDERGIGFVKAASDDVKQETRQPLAGGNA